MTTSRDEIAEEHGRQAKLYAEAAEELREKDREKYQAVIDHLEFVASMRQNAAHRARYERS